jgi:[ribosomal protein S5]-alanine N-acetyltransferase
VITPGNVILNGEGIFLRRLGAADVGARYVQWLADPLVTDALEVRFEPQTKESIVSFVESMNEGNTNLLLGMFLKENKLHIGNIKVGPINWHHRTADVGLVIGERSCWGKGYATAAITLVTNYAFDELNLHKLSAGCYEGNVGSAKAFLRAGYLEQGRRISHFLYNGRYVDSLEFYKLNPRSS